LLSLCWLPQPPHPVSSAFAESRKKSRIGDEILANEFFLTMEDGAKATRKPLR
jgi:hypothetical protein